MRFSYSNHFLFDLIKVYTFFNIFHNNLTETNKQNLTSDFPKIVLSARLVWILLTMYTMNIHFGDTKFGN